MKNQSVSNSQQSFMVDLEKHSSFEIYLSCFAVGSVTKQKKETILSSHKQEKYPSCCRCKMKNF